MRTKFEYYSEDTLISGRIAAAMVKGVKLHKGRTATIKHYAANNQETNRYTYNSIVSQRASSEIYLKGFEICVKESKPKVFMSSYNLINGEHSSQTKDIQTYILRDEWGFDGFVMTDWYATGGMESGKEKYSVAYASGNIKARNDMTMPGSKSDIEDILSALSNLDHPYHITRATLQLSAKNILNTILELTKFKQ